MTADVSYFAGQPQRNGHLGAGRDISRARSPGSTCGVGRR